MDVQQKTEIDIIKFLNTVIAGIESDFDFAYPGGYFDDDKAHTALQSIKGRVRSLKAFTNAVKESNEG